MMQRGILWGGYCSNKKILDEGMQLLLCAGKVGGFHKPAVTFILTLP